MFDSAALASNDNYLELDSFICKNVCTFTGDTNGFKGGNCVCAMCVYTSSTILDIIVPYAMMKR